MAAFVAVLHIHNFLCLTSLFPVSQSKLNTLQVLCPSMSNEDRESLVALATAGLVNWQEDESKNTHMNIHTNFYKCTHAYFVLEEVNNNCACVSQMCMGVWQCCCAV